MTKTKADIITRALRRIRVVAQNRAATADQSAEAGAILDGLFAEIGEHVAITWTLDTTPDAAFNQMADLLAAEIAPEFSRPAPVPRSRAWSRLMAVVNPDDRLPEHGTFY